MKLLHKGLIGILLLAAVVAGYNLRYIVHPSPPPISASKLPSIESAPAPAELLGLYRPGFVLPDLANRVRRLEEWSGKVLLINFWATWCAPCREEIPGFIAAYKQLQPRGFEILGIAIDQPEFVSEFAREFSIPYPLLYGREEAMEVGRQYGNRQGALPYSVFVAADGRITHIHNRGVLSQSELISVVEELLQSPIENGPKIDNLP